MPYPWKQLQDLMQLSYLLSPSFQIIFYPFWVRAKKRPTAVQLTNCCLRYFAVADTNTLQITYRPENKWCWHGSAAVHDWQNGVRKDPSMDSPVVKKGIAMGIIWLLTVLTVSNAISNCQVHVRQNTLKVGKRGCSPTQCWTVLN